MSASETSILAHSSNVVVVVVAGWQFAWCFDVCNEKKSSSLEGIRRGGSEYLGWLCVEFFFLLEFGIFLQVSGGVRYKRTFLLGID